MKITAAAVLAISMLSACGEKEEEEMEDTEGAPELIDEAIEEVEDEMDEKKFDWEIDDKLGDGKIGHDEMGDGKIEDNLGDGDIGIDKNPDDNK